MTDSDISRLYKHLDEIKTAIGEVKQTIAMMNGHCDGCRNSIEVLNTTVFGNGSQGLKSQVNLNTQQIKDHLRETQADSMWRRMALLSAVIAVVGWVVTLYAAIGGK